MFDVFYIKNKPNDVNATKVNSMLEAQMRSHTRYLWLVDGTNDYSNFDFTWEPIPWESRQIHVWPSQWQDNGGTYLISKKETNETNYRKEVISRNKINIPFIY